MYKYFQYIYYKYFDLSKQEYRKLFSYFHACEKILDIGCGQGDFAVMDPKRIIGIDMNRKSLEKAKQRMCQVRFGDARRIPFKSLAFDGVFCAHIIEHFPPKDAYSMLAEIHRVLKVGGLLVIQTPLIHNAFYNNFTHIKVYTPEAVMRYFSDTDQTTYKKIGDYTLVNLIYRYVPIYNPLIEPKRLPDGLFKNIFIIWKCISIFLYCIGVKNYFKKDGYTLIIKKKS